MAVALFDIEVEAVATAGFAAGVFAQREVLSIDFGAHIQATKVLFIRSATGCRKCQAVPFGTVGEVDAVRHQLALGLEARIAGTGTGPGRPTLALGAPVEAQFKQAGRQDLFGCRFGIFQIG